MRILHVHNIANIAWYLARAQESLGHEAKVLIWGKTADVWPGDAVLPTSGGPLSWNIEILRHQRFFRTADVIHIHGGIRRKMVAFGILRRLFPTKRFVVHLHGSETRMGYGLHHLGWANLIICATPDLRRFVPQARYLPNAYPLPEETVPPRQEGDIIIGHFPNRRAMKGTATILQGFRDLMSIENITVSVKGGVTKVVTSHAELWVVEGLPHEQAMNLMRKCDIVVDQIMPFGMYSMVSVEGMSLGKVVICSYDPDYYGNLPIVRVSPEDSLSKTLRDLFARRSEWRRIGQQGRAYVRRTHDAVQVAGEMLRLYRDLPSPETLYE